MNSVLGSRRDLRSISFPGSRSDSCGAQIRTETVNLKQFGDLIQVKKLLRELCFGRSVNSPDARRRIITLLKKDGEDRRCLGELLEFCVHEGGPNGLDVAVDILSQVPEIVLRYAFSFLKADSNNWGKVPRTSRSSDDVWYILARSFARCTSFSVQAKIGFVCLGLVGTWSMRDASLRALADIGGETARKLISVFQAEDKDTFVRATAQELLDSWEN